jgi:16S rRNA processing protein RimM
VGDNRILLGVIGRAHGVRGRVRVTSHTSDPADLTAYGPLTDPSGRCFLLRWCSEGVAEVRELVGDAEVKISDRSTAERLTNTRLYVDRVALPPPEEEDEYYLADLIGLAVVDEGGRAVGTVAVVHDYGAGTSLEIVRDDAQPLIVPFTRACVPVVDPGARRIVIAPPAEMVVPTGAPQETMPTGAPEGGEPIGASQGGEPLQRDKPPQGVVPTGASQTGSPTDAASADEVAA